MKKRIVSLDDIPENKEEFEKKNSSLFPADFIAESLDQTRGWFYGISK